MNTQTYPGDELSLFAEATNWKQYWSTRVAPYVRGAVLEAGAGIGTNTPYLRKADIESWVALEPDPELAAQVSANGNPKPEVVVGTIENLAPERRFDTILYIDVLEHIEEDRDEVAKASSRLLPGGCLIVLCPAHMWLYSEFDRAIGHFRRYTVDSMRLVSPSGCMTEKLEYLDSAGLLASVANRLVLRQHMPKRQQILAWDRVLVPCSRSLDHMFGRRLGKSILAVWRKL